MKSRRLSHDEISTLCLELSMFLHAGADCGGGLMLLAEEYGDTPTGRALAAMARRADGGEPLSRVFEQSGLFPRDVWAMLRAGERAGRSEEALRGLAHYYDRQGAADRRTRSALLYPSILLLVMLAVIAVLLTKVLPLFSRVYASMGGQLTGLAGGMLRLGQRLNAALPALCVILGLLILLLAAFALSVAFRDRAVRLWRKLRGDRGVGRTLSDARFAAALSMAMSSGLSPEEAVVSAGALLEEGPARRRADRCVEVLSEGGTLSEGLRAGALLPPTELRLLELGLAGGSGEQAMEEAARRLDRTAEERQEAALARVEPAMVLICSLLVGVILLSVMLPLANILAVLG